VNTISERVANRENGCLARMVRRGSTVRVRQRALQKRRKSANFSSRELARSPACGAYGALYGAFRFRAHAPKRRKWRIRQNCSSDASGSRPNAAASSAAVAGRPATATAVMATAPAGSGAQRPVTAENLARGSAAIGYSEHMFHTERNDSERRHNAPVQSFVCAFGLAPTEALVPRERPA
jgi:hypothetical protein